GAFVRAITGKGKGHNVMRRIPPRNEARSLPPFAYSGRRDDPIVIPSCSNESAILTVLRTLKSWEHNHGFSFDILTWAETSEIGPRIHQVRFQRRKFTETEI